MSIENKTLNYVTYANYENGVKGLKEDVINVNQLHYGIYIWLSVLMMLAIFATHIVQAVLEKRRRFQYLLRLRSSMPSIVNATITTSITDINEVNMHLQKTSFLSGNE